MERAKELFLHYGGNRYYMSLDGDENEYDRYRVSKETEEEWRREYLDRFLEEERSGRDALGAYAKAAGFLKSDRSDKCGERVLYYPLRSGRLDDVTVLFMLPHSFRLAEKWAKKGKFTRKEAGEYLKALDGFARGVQKRAEDGTLTRAEDYSALDFSDPAYVAGYLADLLDDWRGMA